MSKIAISFNEEASNLTGFVGIIGTDSDSGKVISDKIQATVESVIAKGESKPGGMEVDRRDIVRDLVANYETEEILLLASSFISERVGQQIQRQNGGGHPLEGLLRAMMEDQGK